MSERITNDEVREAVEKLRANLREPGWGMPVPAPTIIAALTELLALRAEVERLRAVEQAARALFPYYLEGDSDEFGCWCSVCVHEVKLLQSRDCLFRKLAAALDANEGSKP